MTPFIFFENCDCYYSLESKNVIHNCDFNPCSNKVSEEDFKLQHELWNKFKNSEYVKKLNLMIQDVVKTDSICENKSSIFISIFMFWYALVVPDDSWSLGVDEFFNVYLFKKNNVPSFIVFYRF